MRIPLHDFMHQFFHVANSCKAKDNSSPSFSHMDCSSLPQATNPKKREGLVASAGRQGFFCTKFAVCSLIPDPSPYTLRLYYCKALFFCFGHFQPSAPLCTLAVRCLHAFKLAGTNRLTTAAMNILGLRIKTVCSNFEMFGHVLDNNLSFMLYFFEKHVA